MKRVKYQWTTSVQCRSFSHVSSAEAHFIYFTMAQITHGSYFNIAPMDIVERLFDFWLLTTSLLFLCIVISRSEHGMRLTALNALRAFSCPVCACVRSMGMYHAHTMRMPECRLRH